MIAPLSHTVAMSHLSRFAAATAQHEANILPASAAHFYSQVTA